MPWLAYRPDHLTIFEQKIEDTQLNNDMKIPRCNRCNPEKQFFFMDLATDHQLSSTDDGVLKITSPTLSSDLVGKRIKSEKISCVKCEKEEV